MLHFVQHDRFVFMKTLFKIFLAPFLAVLLTSCGTARKAEHDQQKEPEIQQDTLPPTHPPVVIPHTWRDA